MSSATMGPGFDSWSRTAIARARLAAHETRLGFGRAVIRRLDATALGLERSGAVRRLWRNGQRRSRYAWYLKLDRVLGAQRPLGTSQRGSEVWVAEHFFIVVHQVVELLFKQALVDFEAATVELRGGFEGDAAARLRRGTAVLGMVRMMFGTLHGHLRRDEFHMFRPALRGATGAQSSQYWALCEHLGLTQGPPSGFAAALEEALEAPRTVVLSDRRDLIAAADDLACVWEGLWSLHLEIVGDLLGDAMGTGGTTGLAHLTARGRQRPFPGVRLAGDVESPPGDCTAARV